MSNNISASNIEVAVLSAPSLAKARGGHAAGVIDNDIVLVGGTLWSDDRITKTWLDDCEIYRKDTAAPPLPHPVAYCAYTGDGKSLYIAGGSDGTNTLSRVYRLTKHSGKYMWEKLSDMNAKLTFTSGAIIDDKFFVACGSDGANAVNTLYMLNLSKPGQSWQQMASLPAQPRMLAALTACKGNLYLFGGFNTIPNQPLAVYGDVYKYEPAKDKWSTLAPLPASGYAWNAAAIDDRFILLCGRADGKVIHKDIWIYDTQNQTAHLSSEQIVIQTATAPLLKASPNKFLLLGGEPDSLKTRTAAVSEITIK